MNRIKQSCALLLAFLLALGVALQPGIGEVFAENTVQTEQIEEKATELTTELTAESDEKLTTESTAERTTESTTENTTESTTENATESTTENATESAAESTTESAKEPTTESTTESVEEPTTESTAESAEEPTTESVAEPATESHDPSFYEQLMACGSLADFDAIMRDKENSAAPDVLTQEEMEQLLGHLEEIYAGIAEPTEAETLLKEELLNELNERIMVICPECGEAGGHAETCSQYAENPADYSWAELADREFAEWLMDKVNADIVRDILKNEGSEEYEALMTRIETILSGEDTELARQLQKYLSVLLELDEPKVMADTESSDYIYFDLAAGKVEIGQKDYKGYVFVDGVAKVVSGSHVDTNKYYVYQSNPTAEESSPVHPKNTGYATDDSKDCRVPTYARVSQEGKSWGDYVTNNTDVKAVSTNWERAAADASRTGTPNNITFRSESGYTADVTVDNIWSTHHQGKNKRTTGGIGANLKNSGFNRTNTHIRLRLKGDNRVGCVHYSAGMGAGNSIEFYDGETGNAPGSITVADFPGGWDQNYWSSAIGASDDPPNTGDFADGIVINSGVIYAGTTSADDCTAIGGGGNNFGGVTITGGTVTAVTASTGTAIGGGIGWGSQGGNAKILISGGNVYAYNLGIGPDSGKYVSFVPAAAIGGGSASTNYGNASTLVEITGGFVYAQSIAGAAIGGGGSGTKKGGDATVNITGGTVIAKSIGGKVNYNKDGNTQHEETVSPGVSIGGGTGYTGGGSVKLTISGENTVLRTGSIGGGKITGEGNIGSANVTITNGDITGQVIMAGGAATNCSFEMNGGRIHDTNLIEGNIVEDSLKDPQPGVKIQYLEKNGGAVWMQDPDGVTTISGGTIENCTAELGGAVFMEGGTFTLSGTGLIQGNTASGTYEKEKGRGGGIYVTGGNANIEGGSISGNTAHVRGGGIYVSNGNVTMSRGSISKNQATGSDGSTSENQVTESRNSLIGRGGGVYLSGGLFTMKGGDITGNSANYRGGGIFLTQSPILTAGSISGNSAVDSGGGLCINGDQLKLTSADMKIYGNKAAKGGGVAVLNGDFILSGGAVGVENGAPNTATEKGGGVYVEAVSTEADAVANATVNSGNIWYNEAKEGGGIYLAKGEGNFTLEGENAVVSHNKANNGGGIYLYKDPNLNQGTIAANTATKNENGNGNGGGIFIGDCLVTLNPTGNVIITGNEAVNGAGIYIHNSNSSNSSNSGNFESPGSSGSGLDGVTSATIPDNGVGLLMSSGFAGTVSFTGNIAEDSGGAVCVEGGRFYQESDRITVTGNQAKNGGGVAVLDGNFTMSGGSIGEENGANCADNGGGVYVSDGEVWLKGGSVKYNTAGNGGGAYVTGGRIVMIDGSLANNKAEYNGGGGYVAGNFRMLGGEVGGNSARNGGGVYVSEGNVYVIYGKILHNYAFGDGGGFHVSAADKAVQVLMLSGSLSSNQAEKNGGGMAVESKNGKNISVEIGCLLNHNVTNGKPKLPIDYTGAYNSYAVFDGKEYKHNSCPEVKDNTAGKIGGGFYMNSDDSTLSFYCVEESGNSAAQSNKDSAGMDVEGGKVVIGDEFYHNHKHDPENGDAKHVVPWGYISMDNTTMVNGGQVDIYGDMTNPVFSEEVTVDIHDPKNDHFMDHRRSKDGHRYKVHYFENFFGTGTYQSWQYNEDNTNITIQGAIFSHPGYQILGWYTKAEYDPAEPDIEGNRFYEVGSSLDLSKEEDVPTMGQHLPDCPICKLYKGDNLLMLYAIWEANGYTVVFDPNVPLGDTYTGSMDDQIHQYGVGQKLSKNEYQYPGHFFAGWNTKPDGSGDPYADEAEVLNLTDKNGGKVVLYAQWKLCDHTEPHRWSYDVIDGGKTLRRICSCGGQTLTATLHAKDTVYDGNTHPATLSFNNETAWGNDKPTIVYTGERLNDGLVHDKPLEFQDGIPYHAGVYTATITKWNNAENGNEKVEVKASIEYTIAKANQPAPENLTYTVEEPKLIISKVKEDPRTFQDKAGHSLTARAQYRLAYYVDSELKYEEWEMIPDGSDTLAITMNSAWTSYIVEARYEELDDYNASDVTRADAVYHYAGDVTVKIICDEGISYRFEPTINNDIFDGATLTLRTEEGYYLIDGDYRVQAQLETSSEVKQIDPGNDPGYDPGNKEKKYSFKDIPNNSTLTITIGTARRIPQAERQVAPGQVFSSFTYTATTISRDSAFTAAFQVSNFDPCYEKDGESYGAYTDPQLTFGSEIPQDTTIILLDRSDGTYWYYRAGDAISSVALTDFQKMGESGTSYSIPQPEQDNGYIDLNYQFIVDFSQSAGGCSGDSLTMALEAPVKDNNKNVPEMTSGVTVSMADSVFTLTKTTDTDSLTHSFTCDFTIKKDEVASNGVASKWENRASALVLIPGKGTVLPADACIKAVVNGGTTYLYKSGDRFIVPLSLLQAGEKTVELTLQSALFPLGENKYSFDVQWLISQSRAGKAPMKAGMKMTGDLAGSLADVTFVSAEEKVPSLKVEGRQRVLTTRNTLRLKIEKMNLEGYTVSAALLRKTENGTYSGTGWNKASVGENLSVSLGGQTSGSFCLMFTVKKENSVTTVMEVPYYFIIKQTQ